MGKGGKGASGGAAVAAKKKSGGSSNHSAGLDQKHDAGAEEGEDTPFIKDDLAAAHTWKPIKRPYLRGSPLENSGAYLISELPIEVLHMEFDWAVRKKNIRLFAWAVISLITVVLELELAFDRDLNLYKKHDYCEGLKAFNSFCTVMLLYYLYDYYDYQVAGAKKDWYKRLYEGENPGPKPSFGGYFIVFLMEFVVLAFHPPPYFDFRYWKEESGTEKPMISDKLAIFCVVRVYLIIRVVRDATRVYSRRRLIYDGGYRERGGPEINYKLAMKAVMINYEALFVAVVYGGSVIVLAYMWHVAERDWQPEDFTFKNCVWLVIFQLAACDYAGLAPKSDIGTLMGVVVVVWGLVIISMLVNVIFNTVVLSSYEGWAIDWLDQYELCEQKRAASAQVIKTWWQYKLGQKDGSSGNNSRVDEATYIIQLVQQYKYLREISYQVGTNSGERASDPVAESQAKMKNDLQLLIAKMHSSSDVEDSEGAVQSSGVSMEDRTAALSQRVEALEGALEVILNQTKEVYTKTMGREPPAPPSDD